MALPVDVKSTEVLRSVRDAFILFSEDAQNALGSMEGEIRRCMDWLRHDQQFYWQSEIKRRKEKLSEAKAELHRKQLSQMFGEGAHDSEQRENVRDAKRRLEEAEDKLENVLRWVPIVDKAVMEYNGQARPFADLLEFDVEKSVGLLDRMIDALDEYSRLEVTSNSTRNDVPTSASPSLSPIPKSPHEPSPDSVIDEAKTPPDAEEEAP